MTADKIIGYGEYTRMTRDELFELNARYYIRWYWQHPNHYYLYEKEAHNV
jgi:hypothetical protein